METNPYQSPNLPDTERKASTLAMTVLRVVAAGLWLFGMMYGGSGFASIFQPASIQLLKDNPYLFFVTIGYGIMLPAFGIILLGLASWRRSFRLMMYGFVLIVPLVLFGVYRIIFFLR